MTEWRGQTEGGHRKVGRTGRKIGPRSPAEFRLPYEPLMVAQGGARRRR